MHTDDAPRSALRVTWIDRVVRFVIGAVISAVGVLALSLLFTSFELFVSATAAAALVGGVATAVWGDRFLVPLLRALGRVE